MPSASSFSRSSASSELAAAFADFTTSSWREAVLLRPHPQIHIREHVAVGRGRTVQLRSRQLGRATTAPASRPALAPSSPAARLPPPPENSRSTVVDLRGDRRRPRSSPGPCRRFPAAVDPRPHRTQIFACLQIPLRGREDLAALAPQGGDLHRLTGPLGFRQSLRLGVNSRLINCTCGRRRGGHCRRRLIDRRRNPDSQRRPEQNSDDPASAPRPEPQPRHIPPTTCSLNFPSNQRHQPRQGQLHETDILAPSSRIPSDVEHTNGRLYEQNDQFRNRTATEGSRLEHVSAVDSRGWGHDPAAYSATNNSQWHTNRSGPRLPHSACHLPRRRTKRSACRE